MALPLVNCLVSYAAVNAIISVQVDDAAYLAVDQSEVGLLDGYRFGPVEKSKVVQCCMPSVQGAVDF